MGINRIINALNKPVLIYPLAGFRVIFGLCLFISTLRFVLLGWINDHYLDPVFHFRYFGWDWVPVGPDWWIYTAHYVLLAASVGLMTGFYYRISALLCFLLFTYTELIDLTYYLNHYYYVSCITLLLVFLPAHRFFSLDVQLGRVKAVRYVPFWTQAACMAMMGIVYLYAGLAKINQEWLLEAQPLRIWLPASYDLPVLGKLFAWEYTPWLFAWCGMLYDCSIFFLLLWKKSRPWAYLSVIFFHSVTGLLFQIGVFPLVMIGGTLVFFSPQWHQRWMKQINRKPFEKLVTQVWKPSAIALPLLTIFFAFQLLFPWRFLLYSGNLLWTEQGYRFGWRVMLMEKAGTATFYVKNGPGGREGEVFNRDFLNEHQEKQMSFQPDMILQYAHFLAEHYRDQGMEDPIVRAEVYVTLNGRPSHLFIDSSVNLAAEKESFLPKPWILPYPYKD